MKIVDFIIIFLGMLIVVSAFVGAKEKERERSVFSSTSMNCMKGIFAVMILLFHLSQRINGGVLFSVIGDTGYLSVAIFFFISGYGMYTRVLQTGGGYCKGIISHRIPKVLLPWIIATLIYALYWFVEGGVNRIIQICSNHKNGYLLITNSWFVIAIVVFYLIFFLAFNKCKENFRLGIRKSFMGVLVYILLAYSIGLGGWWFYSSFAFILGMVWKEREKDINSFIERKWVMFLIGWLGLFVLGYAIRLVNSRAMHSPVVYDGALLIASAAFAGIIFAFLKKVTVNNCLWKFLGNISFEIYLLHELVYNILRNENLGIYISNDFLYVSLTILISIGCAYLFNSIITKRVISEILKKCFMRVQ